jgi:hypothetical protein
MMERVENASGEQSCDNAPIGSNDWKESSLIWSLPKEWRKS